MSNRETSFDHEGKEPGRVHQEEYHVASKVLLHVKPTANRGLVSGSNGHHTERKNNASSRRMINLAIQPPWPRLL